MPDFNNLPPILAGPLLRRVEPTLVTVWVALSVSRTVELGIWTGPTAAPAGFFGNSSAQETASAASIQVGDKLHIALVALDLTAAPLIPGQIYSYNIALTGGSSPQDLNSLSLLEDQGPATERTHLALGYLPNQLPSFALPPIELDRLQLVHGSCRKAHGPGADGLTALDKMIERTRTDPFARPHQLFLTGDQIYADDVAMMLLPLLTETGNALLGSTEKLPLKTGGAEIKVEATAANFPATWRQELIVEQAKFSSGEGSSHVLSFGEFCAIYLYYWSNVSELWGSFPSEESLFPEGDANTLVAALPSHLQTLYPAKDRKKKVKTRNELKDHYDDELERLKNFKKSLNNVRRVLANVPSYMIFDDHEVTDDWYLTQDWTSKVMTAPLGVTALRNGLLSFALFQAWGNDPRAWQSGDRATLLTLAPQLFAGSDGPATAPANQIDTLFGFGGSDPKIEWHYTVPTGPTTTVVLDTRTRRSFVGRYNPPGLLNDTALNAQLPATLAPSPGAEVLLIVSPAPVMGLALIEELLQPLAARGVSDFFMSVLFGGPPKISGFMEWDMEAWSLDAPRFEALLARFFEMRRVVILSGDVHYGFSAEMDYWVNGQPQPGRFVQLTASAIKNQWSEQIKRALETETVQRLLHGAIYPQSRLGWDSPLDVQGNLSVPGNAIPRKMRALLRRTPMVIPIEGWPAGTSISVNPDWSWRMSLVKDNRPDDSSPGARPSDGQVAAISPDIVPSDPEDGYVKVLQRAEKQLKTKIARSVTYASHVGLVTFSGTGATLKVVHSLMYMHPDGDKPADPQPYTVYEMSLAPTTDLPPTIA